MGNLDIVTENIADGVNLAPLLKPSVLTKLLQQFEKKGIEVVIALLSDSKNLSREIVLRSHSFTVIDCNIGQQSAPMVEGVAVARITSHTTVTVIILVDMAM